MWISSIDIKLFLCVHFLFIIQNLWVFYFINIPWILTVVKNSNVSYQFCFSSRHLDWVFPHFLKIDQGVLLIFSYISYVNYVCEKYFLLYYSLPFYFLFLKCLLVNRISYSSWNWIYLFFSQLMLMCFIYEGYHHIKLRNYPWTFSHIVNREFVSRILEGPLQYCWLIAMAKTRDAIA